MFNTKDSIFNEIFLWNVEMNSFVVADDIWTVSPLCFIKFPSKSTDPCKHLMELKIKVLISDISFTLLLRKVGSAKTLMLFLSPVLIFMICFWWLFSVISDIWHISSFVGTSRTKSAGRFYCHFIFIFLQSFVWEYRAIQVQIRALPI